jgi:hypothetical protein
LDRSIETIESERISEASDGYPSALWGLHLLAWATGLQDIIANVLLASLALPSMAGTCSHTSLLVPWSMISAVLISVHLQLRPPLQHRPWPC